MTKSLRLLFALSILIVPHACFGLTLADLKVQIRQHLDDRADPKVRYSDTMLLHFINEGQRDIVNRSWCLQKTMAQSLSVRTTYYALPTDMIAIQEVNFFETTTKRTRQLEEKTERALYQENPDYARQRGAPSYYFVRHSTYGSTQLELGLTPVPSSSSVLGIMYVDYYNQATDVSVSTDVVLNGFNHLYPYHTSLVNYVVGRIKMFQGDVTGGAAYMAIYDADVKRMIDRLGQLPNYTPGFQVGTGK